METASMTPPIRPVDAGPGIAATDQAAGLSMLDALERKVLWLSTWMIHHANHLRPHRDGVKVGGHQASCASATTLMTALFFSALRSQDRVAVKPHASPVFHAIQYLLGNQSLAKRAFPKLPDKTHHARVVTWEGWSAGEKLRQITHNMFRQHFSGALILLCQLTGNESRIR